MPKRCVYAKCNSDARYPERLVGGVVFFPFPKPKTQLEKCILWIKQCGRSDSLKPSKITTNYYVCSKHFVDGRPTPDFPNPVAANMPVCDGEQRREHLGGCRNPPAKRILSEPIAEASTSTITESASSQQQHHSAPASPLNLSESASQQQHSAPASTSNLPINAMSQEDLRTAVSMSPTFTLEENNNPTDTEAGRFGFLPVCKEEASPEQQEKSPSLVQEKLKTPQIKEEQEEILLSPGDVAGSSVTLLAVKSEDDHDNIETESQTSILTEHIKTQAYIKSWVPSQPTSDDQFLASHCSESDTDDSDDRETRDDETAVNTLASHNTHEEGQSLSLSNKLRSLVCTVCSKRFNKSANLKTHMMIHTGKKPYVCTICSKSFSQTENLKTHMRIHTGEKPFACTVCSKSFSQTQHLKKHMRVHSGERPFDCTVCNKSFKHNHSLKAHMIIHTGEFACIFCNKRFDKTASLKTHMKVHTGEKPFACTICSKSFNQPQHLKTHMKTHPTIHLPDGQEDTTNRTFGFASHTVVPIRPKLATTTVPHVSAMRIVTVVAPGAASLQSAPRMAQTLWGSAMTMVTPGATCSLQGPPGAAGPTHATSPTGGL